MVVAWQAIHDPMPGRCAPGFCRKDGSLIIG
jgi:hypothetical protein